MMKRGLLFAPLLCVVFFALAFPAHAQKAQNSQFLSVNCMVRDVNGQDIPVAAYRNVKNHDEIILISRSADHALIVDLKNQKAYKVQKPLLGTTSVIVSNVRPSVSGNVGFMVRRNGRHKEETEIIVYFHGESCFLCGPQTFATIWE
jgi:hypothetical protein